MSVYAANRLNSIRENKAEEVLDEFTQAFLDESKETADVTPFGIIAQLHENDMRMFDAVITSDFSAVAESVVLEAEEAEENKGKIDEATKKSIGTKIKEFFVGLKNAIIAIYRKLRDKVLELVNADKKIVKLYEPIIKNLPSNFKISSNSISKDAFDEGKIGKVVDIYNKIGFHASKVIDHINDANEGKVSNNYDLEAATKNLSDITEEFAKSMNELSNTTKAQVFFGKSDILDCLDLLKSGKAALESVKKGGARAVKAINDIDKCVKTGDLVTSKQANACYIAISKAGKEIAKVSKIHTRVVAKSLAEARKIVLLAGRTAKNGVSESALDQYVIDALMESSDLYVAEKFAY